jgi:hypothetical protein
MFSNIKKGDFVAKYVSTGGFNPEIYCMAFEVMHTTPKQIHIKMGYGPTEKFKRSDGSKIPYEYGEKILKFEDHKDEIKNDALRRKKDEKHLENANFVHNKLEFYRNALELDQDKLKKIVEILKGE